jgi:hypothetical protein
LSAPSPSTPYQIRQPQLPIIDNAPGVNPFLRCVMLTVNAASPDNLRQFYRAGTPQKRVLPLR